MFLRDLRYRVTDRIVALFNDDRQFVKLFSRLGFLALLAGIIAVVAPTSATENSPDPAPTEIAPTDTQTATVDTSTATVDTSTATPEPTASPAPVDTSTVGETLTVISIKETVTALANQPKFIIRAPTTLTIDPRAMTKYLPQLSISGSEYALACITGSNVNLDISAKGSASDAVENGIIVVGDLTSTLFVSGKNADVVNLINSDGGLLAFSRAGGLANRSITIEMVAMSKPGVKRAFCDFAKSSATLSFQSMGLEMNTNKSGIDLN
jgi:hypothetical protein